MCCNMKVETFDAFFTGELSSWRGLLGGDQLLNRAIRLIDCAICVRMRASIRIRNRDTSEWLTRDHIRLFVRRPSALPQSRIFISVAVRPPVDGDCLNILDGIESAGAQRTGELVSNI